MSESLLAFGVGILRVGEVLPEARVGTLDFRGRREPGSGRRDSFFSRRGTSRVGDEVSTGTVAVATSSSTAAAVAGVSEDFAAVGASVWSSSSTGRE